MYINQNLKIQVRSSEMPWADLEKLPEFETYDQARTWMADQGLNALQEKHDIQFRIVPMDVPAAATAVLERNESHDISF